MSKPPQPQLLAMKKNILESCFKKEMKWKDGAALLGMHAKALSRLKKRYLAEGEVALTGRKPGPKSGRCWNRTPEDWEDKVVHLAKNFPGLGPIDLADKMGDLYGMDIEQTTVWRILTRRKVRYSTGYSRWKPEPKLYCLDRPGQELQMDACYPFGRSRPVASFDAIDDCSRLVFGKAYQHEDAASAIAFVSELLTRVPFVITKIRVDNRYGKAFKAFVESLGIELHENDPYTPEQNGKIERFHKTLKNEFYFQQTSFADTLDEINYKYGLWLHYYNYERKHQGYGMNRLTPAQKLTMTYLKQFANDAVCEPQKVTLMLQQYIFCRAHGTIRICDMCPNTNHQPQTYSPGR
jgi:hypothetical protein